MREPNTALQEYNQTEELVTEDTEKVIDAFHLPKRNWELIISSYNEVSRSKFPFTALQCKMLVEYVKKDIPPKFIFQSLGISSQKYTSLVNKSAELEDKLIELSTKSKLSDSDYEQFQTILRHPLRILMSDLDRAEGVANLAIWERFNEMAVGDQMIMSMKMKGKFKDFFEGGSTHSGGNQVTINLSPGLIEGL